MKWLAENVGNIVVVIILLIVLGLALFSVIRRKRKGLSSCGCDCGSCGMSGFCNKEKK